MEGFMAEQPLHMPLAAAEVRVLAAPARFVDRCGATRAKLMMARSLTQIIDILGGLGYNHLTADLLIRARHHVGCTGWIWQRSSGQFQDHLYILSLITLIDRHIHPGLPPGQLSSSVPSQGSSSEEIHTGLTLDQALNTVRAHGYLPVKLHALLDVLDIDALAWGSQARRFSR
jgi:hypothetical protein